MSRDRILMELKTRGPKDAQALARRLRVTAVAVRQHLVALEADGLITADEERRGVGRPTRVWRLTDAAASRFPDGYADLAVDMIRSVRSTFGDDGLARLVRDRTRQQLRQYRAAIPSDAPLDKRVAALTRLRKDEGYMAEWKRGADGTLLLIENHCPICAAAQICQGLCDGEMELFRGALGRGVRLERQEHMLDGARRCVYRITDTTR